jgi:hypothetical protein
MVNKNTVVPSHDDYVHAAATLWGDAGVFAYRTFDALNDEYFDGGLPALPIVIGITAFGKCIALTRSEGTDILPRITLASNIFAPTGHGQQMRTAYPYGANVVRDVLLHEMIHAQLRLDGQDGQHNGQPWCDAITRLSPAVLGHGILAAPVKARRVDGKVVKAPRDGYLPQAALASWPGSLRPDGWDRGPAIPVPSY